MQRNNDFQTLMNKWRRMSVVDKEHNIACDTIYRETVERRNHSKEPCRVALNATSMSGDSSNHETLWNKKDEEPVLLAPEPSQHKALAGAVADMTAEAAASPSGRFTNLPKKETLPNEDDQESANNDLDSSTSSQYHIDKHKDGDGDKKDLKEGELEALARKPEDQLEDKVDSVYARAPAAKRAAISTSPPPEEEGCGLKCLYYTLQCCDCVLS